MSYQEGTVLHHYIMWELDREEGKGEGYRESTELDVR